MRSKLPVKSSRHNALIAILGIASLFCCEATAQSSELTPAQNQWVARQIFNNECSQQERCLTSWNAGEDFPSLGLGHFIWYRQGQREIYTETFPELLRFYHDQGVETPTWITSLPTPDSPWQNRQQFYADFDQPPLQELRNFLLQTLPLQARFIMQRQEQALPGILEHAPAEQREDIAALYWQVAAAAPPYGRYALIDYVNFKGEGTAASERYLGEGWGLLQVLQEMLNDRHDQPVLKRFSEAAAAVLERRVTNAPPERNEQRWLAGWFNRLNTYLPPELR